MQTEKKQMFMDSEQLLTYWLANRRTTRKLIEKFPEKDLFEFSIGGMRPFGEMVNELLSVAGPGLNAIVTRTFVEFSKEESLNTKEALLSRWDEETERVAALLMQIPEADFEIDFKVFGTYSSTTWESILYFIDNELHHSGQAYVYLRALGIEPPIFMGS